MSDQSGPDHAAEIARKRAEIARLEAEIAAHRKALGQGLAPSPFAPDRFPDLPRVAGLRLAAAVAGVRYRTGRTDVMLAELAPGSVDGGGADALGARAPRLCSGARSG